LQYENRKYGITMQILSPSVIKTNMTSFTNHNVAHPCTLVTPTAETYAKQAIGTLGVVDHSAGFYLHSIMVMY